MTYLNSLGQRICVMEDRICRERPDGGWMELSRRYYTPKDAERELAKRAKRNGWTPEAAA